MTASTLILPVENQVRELDAKLLLAAVAAERGFPVVLGSRAFVHYALHRLPRGVYLAKSMRRLSERVFSIARDLGHEIVGFDEEALVHAPPAAYYERRLSDRAVRQVSHLLCWGSENAELFAGFEAAHGIPVHQTGNPRTDLLRPELRDYFASEADALRREFGDFILFNSSFGAANAYVPALRETGLAESANAPGAFATGRGAHRRELFEHCLKGIPALAAAFPDRLLVVRPHPSESHTRWAELAEQHANLRVIARGSVLPWLIAAAVAVHNGCTTGLEGTLLDRPVIAYMPVVSELYDEHLPNSLSHRVHSIPELVERVRDGLDGRLGPVEGPERDAATRRYLVGTEGALASDRIVDVLEQVGYGAAPPSGGALPARLRGIAHNLGRTRVKRMNWRREGHRGSEAYHDHRFPPIAVSELQARVERLGAGLGRFREIRVRERSAHLFDVVDRSRFAGTPS